jgi:CHAT domain-containing protein/tetratricopeptide (TPR) repeat protein
VRRLGAEDNGATAASFNLGLVHLALGDVAEARRELQRAASTWEKVLGPGHVNVARALSALAETLAQQGGYTEARSLYERALKIRERELGVDNQLVGRTLSNLAITLARLDQGARALELSQRSVGIWEKSGVQEGLAEALFIHGGLLASGGNWSGARAVYDRSRQIRLALFGPSHPLVGETEIGLAAALVRLDDQAEAFAGALRGEEIGRNHARLTLGTLAERQALDYAARRPRGLDLAISLVPSVRRASPALDAVILGRSLTLDEIASRQRSRADSPDLAPLWERLTSARRRLANVIIRGAGPQNAAQHAAIVDEARREKEQAERVLAERSATFRSQLARGGIGLDQVRAALPPGSALASFVRYERTEPLGNDARKPAAPSRNAAARNPPPVASYAVFVLRPESGEPIMVPLGSVDVIEPLIARWRRDMTGDLAPRRVTQSDTAFGRSAVQLRQRIWDPIATHLAGVKRLFVVPDAALNLIPLAALPADGARYLLEDGPAIHYLSAERDLVSIGERGRSTRGGLLAIGGPAFADPTVFANSRKGRTPAAASAKADVKDSAAGTALQRGAEFRTATCSSFQSIRFPQLPGSAREVDEVAALWRAGAATAAAAQVLTGPLATESAVKRLGPGNRILHFATHGFFLGDECGSALDGTRAIGGLAPAAPRASRAARALRQEPPENPLVLSGLALAGANRRSSAGADEDDAILTAEEVASLNLEGVEWAVLSACDTGLGHLRAGEGVFGLRRAFQIAGVRTTIMSLWPVEDHAARQWMRALYEGRLQRGLDTPDALREASLAALRERRAKGQSTNPFFWAGFVAAGDWH